MAQAQTVVLHRNSPKFANQNSPSETNHSYHNQRPPMPLVSPNNQRNNIVNVPLQVVNSPARASQDRASEKHNLGQNDDKDHKFFIEIRSCLMTVATLAAGCAYQAGLSPPGGFWDSDGSDGHQKAGNPILFDNSTTRYEAFYYCNGVSFVSSLVIIILLMNDHFSGKLLRVRVLKLMMVLDLCSFMAAYAVGSCRSVTTSIIMFVLLGGVSAYVLIFTVVAGLCFPDVPVLQKLATGARSGINRVRSGFRVKSRNNRVCDDRSEV